MQVTMSLDNYDSFALLNAILTEIEETGSIDDAHSKQLHALFGTTFISALNLLDRKAVKKVTCPANRSFITIAESTEQRSEQFQAPKSQLRCFLKRRYCTCRTFSNKVVHNSKLLMCDHLLAAHIAERLKDIQLIELSNEEFGEALYLLRTS